MSLIPAALLQADILQQSRESPGERLLFRPRLQPFFRLPSASRQLCELHDLSPISRRDNADDRRRLFHLLVRPESPSDVVPFKRFRELGDPLIRILPGLTHPDGHVITFATINVLL